VPLSWNLGILTSWNHLGHCWPVTGLLYLYTFLLSCMSIRILVAFLSIIRPDFIERLTDARCARNCEAGKICDVIFSDTLSQCGSTTFHIQFMQKNTLFSSQYTESNPWTKTRLSNLDVVPLLYNFGHSCNAHDTNRHLATCHMCLEFSVQNLYCMPVALVWWVRILQQLPLAVKMIDIMVEIYVTSYQMMVNVTRAANNNCG
jgi:hypothetical protein